jgi:type IV secretory pathway VirB2 component (pilin)
MKHERDRKSLLCLVLCLLISHWLGLLPVALSGSWQNYFVPYTLSMLGSVSLMVLPLAVMGILFWFGKQVTWLWTVQVVNVIALFFYTKPQLEILASELKVSIWGVIPYQWQQYLYFGLTTLIFSITLLKFEQIRGRMFSETSS